MIELSSICTDFETIKRLVPPFQPFVADSVLTSELHPWLFRATLRTWPSYFLLLDLLIRAIDSLLVDVCGGGNAVRGWTGRVADDLNVAHPNPSCPGWTVTLLAGGRCKACLRFAARSRPR